MHVGVATWSVCRCGQCGAVAGVATWSVCRCGQCGAVAGVATWSVWLRGRCVGVATRLHKNINCNKMENMRLH